MRLQQVIVNLISNALDAMEDRAAKEIGISVETDGTATEGTCAISVRDRGHGLSEAALAQAFDSVLHHQGPGQGHGAGPVDLLQHHPRFRRHAVGGQRSRWRGGVHRDTAPDAGTDRLRTGRGPRHGPPTDPDTGLAAE